MLSKAQPSIGGYMALLEAIEPVRRADQITSFEKLGKVMLRKFTSESVIGRHVNWLKNSNSKAAAIGKGILTGAEAVGLAVMIIGIPVIVLGVQASSKIEKYNKLRKIEDGKDLEPPDLDTIPARDINVMTFNHTHHFCLKDRYLWVKPIKDGERLTDRRDWRLLYYDGYIKGHYPQQLSADGANFAAMDEERVIHYKKIIKEYRDKFLCWEGKYHSVSLIDEDNYTEDWFSFPFIGGIYGIFNDNRLRIPRGAVWSMSHRGEFVDEYTDAAGYKHKEFPTTTIHAGQVQENESKYADPYWYSKFEGNIIRFPEDFKLIWLSSSASTLFAYGTVNGQGVFYVTQDADFDKRRRNPILPSHWCAQFGADQTWVPHPDIQLKGKKASHTGKVTIYQTGVGDNERMMNVIGTGPNGEDGIYEKRITELNSENWVFKEVRTGLEPVEKRKKEYP